MDEKKQFEENCRQISTYLAKHEDPYKRVEIDSQGAKMVSTVSYVPVKTIDD